ncbi:hypothetical protein SARC_12138 [Sphaeroforma arctica JP610]|uniref:Uncharacterized protein n=1 Tax=Sphaeroforma arctica JP610 TaxID=667725 RepID=A0A0L0FFT1_9EUKA|nr:hypothetical protein SARC_12138 [Sphaeroforma arctica JP610]KNC75336.1 hypothetical protein SARC_12138 [Sphaeroforma arctica JP610]|eukprot:XP_014149238.1 hypothetical protein SARC_12138 [Sphaeroforma arctica JP610]
MEKKAACYDFVNQSCSECKPLPKQEMRDCVSSCLAAKDPYNVCETMRRQNPTQTVQYQTIGGMTAEQQLRQLQLQQEALRKQIEAEAEADRLRQQQNNQYTTRPLSNQVYTARPLYSTRPAYSPQAVSRVSEPTLENDYIVPTYSRQSIPMTQQQLAYVPMNSNFEVPQGYEPVVRPNTVRRSHVIEKKSKLRARRKTGKSIIDNNEIKPRQVA